MKNILILLVSCLVLSGTLTAQELKDLDYISPFHEGIAAVKKAGQWAFINTKGEVMIDYRSDLVIPAEGPTNCCSTDDSMDYPFFKDGRCMIRELNDGIAHYGYINLKGITVIKTDLINATHFNDNKAIVLRFYKERIGRNDLLDKNVVSYSYNEIVINTMGEDISHLRGPFNLVYSKEKLKTPPEIQSHFINPDLVAVKTENGTWKVQAVNQK